MRIAVEVRAWDTTMTGAQVHAGHPRYAGTACVMGGRRVARVRGIVGCVGVLVVMALPM